MRYLDRKFNGFTWWRHVSRIRVKLDEAVRRWNELDWDARKMRGRQAETEKRRIKAEKGDLEMRVSEDLKTGLFGSIGQRCPVDVDELSKLLHEPNSRLGELFRSYSLVDWGGKAGGSAQGIRSYCSCFGFSPKYPSPRRKVQTM